MTELRNSSVITVSSEYSSGYAKEYAVDGNYSTAWASAGDGVTAWILFTWAAPVTIREVRLRPRVEGWPYPVFTFSDYSYYEGWTLPGDGADSIYPFLHPKTTTTLKISMDSRYPPGDNAGFAEVFIDDAWTITPTTDLTHSDHLLVSSQYDNGSWKKWNTVDGNQGTGWATLENGVNSWIQFEWSSPVLVESFQLRDRGDPGVLWGVPRFTFDDASYQDGTVAPDNVGMTNYTLATPKTTTTLRISISSGGTGETRGLGEIVLTGNVDGGSPPAGGSGPAGTVAQVLA